MRVSEESQHRKGVSLMRKPMLLLAIALFVTGLVAVVVGPASGVSGREVRDLIETLEVGEPVYYDNLTVIPLYSTHIRDHARYTTLDEALDGRWLEITEIGGGSVPKIKVNNRSDNYIYVMGGEILTGCRQDRIVGRDVLLRPWAKNVIVPVYCVEQGRWAYESDEFYSKRNLGTSRLRAESQKASSDAQGDIWSEVRVMIERSGASSGTGRFQEAYESAPTRRRIAGVEEKMGRIPRLYPDAIGVIVAVGDEIINVDIFANPHVLGRLWPKILKSSALAVVCHEAYGTVGQSDAVRFLRRLHDKHYTMKPAVDLGFELSVVDGEINANALVYRDAVIHLAAFPEGDAKRLYRTTEDDERRIRVMRR
jgi:hypothetical protein